MIGARDNNLGVIGTAPGTPLWSVRVVDDAGVITEEMLICAIDWVTATHKDDDPDNDIAVANISIGGPGTETANCGKGTDPMHYAICRSVRAGVTYAVAAGNAGAGHRRHSPGHLRRGADRHGHGGLRRQARRPDAAPICGPEDWSKVRAKG